MSTNRIARLTQAMQEQGLAAVAIMPSSNLRYLTGLTFHPSKRLTLALFPADGSAPRFVLPALEVSSARAHSLVPLQLYSWSDAEGPLEALRSALASIRPSAAGQTIGVEYTAMRVMELRALEECAPGITTVDATPILAGMRMVKDADELAAMAQAARIVEVALRETIAQIKPGMTERELSSICSNAILAAGGEGESFENIVASGPNSANAHHTNSDRPFQVGDLILIDCGAVYGGYASDITRTVALGEPGPEARKIYDLVLRANAAGRAAVRPGATGEDVDRAARTVIEEGGYGAYFVHRTGHGLGLEINPCHEPPDMVAGNTQPLAVGTTFTVEPGIYLEGVGGVRIEDDVVVTEDGHRSLTGFERELIVLPA